MSQLIANFPIDGVVTVNRVVLKPEYTVDDLEERVALLCENVKTYHSETGFISGFVSLNSGQISNEGSSIGQPVAHPFKEREALDRDVLEFVGRARTIASFRHLPTAFPAGSGPVRKRQRGDRLFHALVRRGLLAGRGGHGPHREIPVHTEVP